MNFKTIIYAAAAVMAASCGNSSTKTAEQQPAEERLVNVRVMAAQSKDVPQSGVYSSTVEAYAKNNIAPQSPSRIWFGSTSMPRKDFK